MKTSKIDSLINSILFDKSNQSSSSHSSQINPVAKIEGEPAFTIVFRGLFKKTKWKCINRCYINAIDAYHCFNEIMSQLEKLPNIEIDLKESKIYFDWRYYVNIFWRNIAI